MKRITVISDDPDTPRFALTMKGKLVLDVKATPPNLIFRDVGPKQSASLTFELELRDPKAHAIESVIVEDEELFSIERLSPAGENPARYELSYAGRKTVGRDRSTVRVETSSPDLPELTLPVTATVSSDLRYSKRVHFMRKNGVLLGQTIRITNRKGDAPKIEKVEDPDGLLELEILPAKGAQAQIEAHVNEDELAKLEDAPRARHELIVHTDHEVESRIELEYMIVDRQRPLKLNKPKPTAGAGTPQR